MGVSVWSGVGLGSGKDVLSHHDPVPTLPHRLAGAGGRKKIFRLSDVLKPLTDAQVEAMKLGAVKRILRAEKAVACSGAAQVCPSPLPMLPGPPCSQPRDETAPASLAPGPSRAAHQPSLPLFCLPANGGGDSSSAQR